MIVFRISQEIYAKDLSGNGAWLYGGRWNSPGQYALYTSSSRSLAMLEILAHMPSKMLTEKPYYMVSLEIDKIGTEWIQKVEALAENEMYKSDSNYTRMIGDKFIHDGKSIALEVPSVIIPEEKNYIFNPAHPSYSELKIIDSKKVEFDPRHF